MIRLAIITLLILLSYLPPVMAEEPPPLPPFLQKLEEDGARIKHLGFELGFDNWLATKNGEVQFFFSIPENGGVVSGTYLIGPEGENITAKLIVNMTENDKPFADSILADARKAQAEILTEGKAPEARPAASSPASKQKDSPGERLLREAEGANWIPLGENTAPALYVFMDTQCSYCHQYWRELQSPYVESGQVQVRLVPVSILGEKSLKEATTLLSAGDPAAAWAAHVDGDITALAGQSNAIAQDAVIQNTEIFTKWGMESTPYTVYRGSDGKVKIVVGMQPGKARGVVADLTGRTPG